MRCAIYVRVSTLDQQVDNQLIELRRYVVARAWSAVEYVDHGVSGAKDRRPALDALLKDARRRKFDVLVCWRLDRLGRNLKHLITMLDELQALGVAFVSLAEGIDAGHEQRRRDRSAPLYHHQRGVGFAEPGQIVERRQLEERWPVVDRLHRAEGQHDARIDRRSERGPASRIVVRADLGPTRRREHDEGQEAGEGGR